MPDEMLIAYVAKARRAGALDAARLGLSIFAQRRWRNLVLRAKARMPTWDDAEDVAAQTLRDVFRAAFDGQSVGEAVNFIHRILARRIADWHDARKQTDELPQEHEGSDDSPRAEVGATEDDTKAVDVQLVTAKVFDELESDHHREVVRLAVFQGYGSKETAASVNTSFPELDPPMTDQNVDQIKSRFRKKLRSELGLD